MSGGGARSSVLTEFFAHNDPINCACISGIVFATGGEPCGSVCGIEKGWFEFLVRSILL